MTTKEQAALAAVERIYARINYPYTDGIDADVAAVLEAMDPRLAAEEPVMLWRGWNAEGTCWKSTVQPRINFGVIEWLVADGGSWTAVPNYETTRRDAKLDGQHRTHIEYIGPGRDPRESDNAPAPGPQPPISQPAQGEAREHMQNRPPVRHTLKTWPPYFDAVLRGEKTFELRHDDRGFAVGDTLVLQEWDPATKRPSGRSVERVVTFIAKAAFGLRDETVCMALAAPPAAPAMPERAKPVAWGVSQTDGIVRHINWGEKPAPGDTWDVPFYAASDYDAAWSALEAARRENENLREAATTAAARMRREVEMARIARTKALEAEDRAEEAERRFANEHCRDCCCARIWEALLPDGISNGLASIWEVAKETREQRDAEKQRADALAESERQLRADVLSLREDLRKADAVSIENGKRADTLAAEVGRLKAGGGGEPIGEAHYSDLAGIVATWYRDAPTHGTKLYAAPAPEGESVTWRLERAHNPLDLYVIEGTTTYHMADAWGFTRRLAWFLDGDDACELRVTRVRGGR